MDWKPSADFKTLKQRAGLLDAIRRFFKTRNVLEVETPLLSHYTVTDRYIDSFKTSDNYYLQTSPEYAMKRLLAAGSGPIFQITKAFRQEESGHQHNPEFTLLEWYRPGFSHNDLMDEMDELLIEIASFKKAERISYQDLFKTYCQIDPLTCDDKAIKTQLKNNESNFDRDTSLQLLLSEKIEPYLGKERPTFVYDFPATQAALAKIRKDNPPVAERFEVFIHGKEIANGFHELTNAEEQLQRFKADQHYRKIHQKTVPEIDKRFITALQSGLPNCAGVALGLDRLLMCMMNKKNIREVVAFDSNRA